MSESAMQPLSSANVEDLARETTALSIGGMTAILIHNDEVTKWKQ